MNNFSANIIIIPIYNDWKSLNKLLLEINQTLNDSDLYKILIVNDSSTQKIDIQKKQLDKIKEIKILTTTKNLGSQKSIGVALNYLKGLNSTFYITIMDGDGEDNPSEIEKMLNMAKIHSEYIITSHRKERNEKFIIKFAYKIHLIITFFLTLKWVSFGNFSCFNSNNLNKLNLNDVLYAYSAGVLKSCKIKKIYSTRQKRYFDSSKVNFLKLVEHSLRIISVFYERVFVGSLLYVFIAYTYFSEFNILLYSLIFIMNFLILFVKYKNYQNLHLDYKNFINDITLV